LTFSVTTRNVLRVLCDVCCQWTSRNNTVRPLGPKRKTPKGLGKCWKNMVSSKRGKTYLHTSSGEKGSSWLRVEYRGSQTSNSWIVVI